MQVREDAFAKRPVHIFYNILDLAIINAWIIYKEVTGQNITRINFILNLAEELRTEYKNLKKVLLSQIPVNAKPKIPQDTSAKLKNASQTKLQTFVLYVKNIYAKNMLEVYKL